MLRGGGGGCGGGFLGIPLLSPDSQKKKKKPLNNLVCRKEICSFEHSLFMPLSLQSTNILILFISRHDRIAWAEKKNGRLEEWKPDGKFLNSHLKLENTTPQAKTIHSQQSQPPSLSKSVHKAIPGAYIEISARAYASPGLIPPRGLPLQPETKQEGCGFVEAIQNWCISQEEGY